MERKIKAFLKVNGFTTAGQESQPRHRRKRPSRERITSLVVEQSGQTGRDRLIMNARSEFLAKEGIDRETFEKKYGRGSNYKKWREFAAEHGLDLPV